MTTEAATTRTTTAASKMHDRRIRGSGDSSGSGYSAYKMIKDLLAVGILVALVVMNYLNISVIRVFDTLETSSNHPDDHRPYRTGPASRIKRMQRTLPFIKTQQNPKPSIPAKKEGLLSKPKTPKIKTRKKLILRSSSIQNENDSASSQSHFLVEKNDKIYGGGDKLGFDTAPIVDEKHKLIFFSVPKVACTTFKFLFRRIRGVEDWDIQDSEEGRNLPHNPAYNNLKYLWDYPIETANEMMTDPEWTRAIFVRDPKTRFLSAFLDKSVGNYGSYVTRACCSDAMQCKTDNYPGGDNTVLKTILNCQEEGWDSRKNRLDVMWLEERPCCTLLKECKEKIMTVEGFLETIETCNNMHWGKFNLIQQL